jgi:hypothetical protein
MRRLAPLLLLLALAACAGKRESRDRIDWGEMRELFPPQVNAASAESSPATPAASEAATAAVAAQETRDAAAPSQQASRETPDGESPQEAAAPVEQEGVARASDPTPDSPAPRSNDATPDGSSAPAPRSNDSILEPSEASEPTPVAGKAALSMPGARSSAGLDAHPPAFSTAASAPAAQALSEPEAAAALAETSPPQRVNGADASEHAAPADPATTPKWPHVVAANGVSFEVYAPQVDAWDGEALLAHALVKAQAAGDAQPAIGALRMTARTAVDDGAKTVALQDLRVTAARFPGAPDKTQAAWLETLRAGLPQQADGVSLDRVESGVAVARARERGAAVVRVSAPQVVIAKKPAVLVYIDGDPRYVPVKGTELSGVLNTRALLIKDAEGRHHLRLYDGWVSAETLRGPWAATKPPAEAAKLEQMARASGRANLLRGKADPQTKRRPALKNESLPQILVATKPTALLVLAGEPRFEPVAGTSLQYATNTSAHLFRDVEAKQLYVRIAGYWFRSGSTAGPWEFVAADRLPDSFAAIPDDSPKRGVKAGIAAAKRENAAPARGIAPVMVAAHPERTSLRLALDGDPRVEPLEGTQLHYVANASLPVIQVDGGRWFAVQKGAWFNAETVAGPWRLTDSVPPEIYAIPPSSAIYPAIHSRVYSSSDDVVYFAYEPSLLGISGGAVGVEDQGEDYQYTPPTGIYWGWFY